MFLLLHVTTVKISHFASKSHSEIWKQNSKQSLKVISVALNMLLTKKYLNLLFCNNSNSLVSMGRKIKAISLRDRSLIT